MLKARNILVSAMIFLSLLLVDYILDKTILQVTENEVPMNIPVLISEVLFISLTMALINRYSVLKRRDRIDDLLQESRQALRTTNDFLEKWRRRRVETEYSYLDEEPQPITPLKLEVPILHMAIIDTRGTNRYQPERGDAGDSIHFTDSTLLSVTSLLDDDLEPIYHLPSDDRFD